MEGLLDVFGAGLEAASTPLVVSVLCAFPDDIFHSHRNRI